MSIEKKSLKDIRTFLQSDKKYKLAFRKQHLSYMQANEDAWKFYEKLGYHKAGGFFPPEQGAEEWMYIKELGK